jgi:hypothetical protein
MGPRFESWSLTELNSTIVDLLSMSVRLDRMARFSQEEIAKFIRGISARQIRLACGLVLFAYLISHFLNHALGNISMDALAAGVYYHTLFWQFLPVAIAFYTAALVHAGLGTGRFTSAGNFAGRRSSRCSSCSA